MWMFQGLGVSGMAELTEKKKTVPHIYNLNMDPMLTGHIVRFLDKPEVKFGKGGDCDIQVIGPRSVQRLSVLLRKQ